MLRELTVAAALLLTGADAGAPGPDAIAFGAREGIAQVSLSPDGQSVAVLAPSPGRGTTVIVITLTGAHTMTPVLHADGKPDQITGCGWATDTRLICSMYRVMDSPDGPTDFSRLVSVSTDGKDVKILSDRGSSTALGISHYGGSLVDYQSGDDSDSVLLTRYYVPEVATGHLTAQSRQGLGVDRVNVTNLKRRTVVSPNDSAFDYISDGQGQVRIMLAQPRDSRGNDRNEIDYFYRLQGKSDWLPLSKVTLLSDGRGYGFQPVAIDPTLNVAYGFDAANGGRSALFKIALDGSLKRDIVFQTDGADVDDIVRLGRQQRTVGVTYAAELRHVAYFDPELKQLSAALGKALPGLPLVNIAGASADESVLLIWAGSDDDPGSYFIYTKATHQLAPLLQVRPQLAGHKLAKVQPITYPAADGTMIPAYLTLPPGGAAKGLPAIVMPHGGPASRDEWGFDWLAQFFAARGYAVIQPNYRGSTGYGEKWFQKNGFQSWKTAIGDVDDAGRWLVKQGIAAPDKLAIVGWSYGGYAALQSGVTDPGLFKAIVAVAPVTDLDRLRDERKNYSDYNLRDAFIGRGPHVDAGSPARHADQITAPVLIFHGDRDMNVDVSESRLMRDRLQAAGKRVDYVEFDGLDHQLEDDDVRAQMLDRIDTFLKANLQ